MSQLGCASKFTVARLKPMTDDGEVPEPMSDWILKVNRGTFVSFFCACVSVCVRVRLPDGGGGATSFLTPHTCLCWPDVDQLVPCLFSLAEYGSAGERSRRAKKRNIGRYT